MSAQTQAAISTWVTLLGGIISVAFIVHASGSLTERLSEHDRTIIELKQADRASADDRRRNCLNPSIETAENES
jgi:hypothetical protein